MKGILKIEYQLEKEVNNGKSEKRTLASLPRCRVQWKSGFRPDFGGLGMGVGVSLYGSRHAVSPCFTTWLREFRLRGSVQGSVVPLK